uniref:Metal-dependent hydrolase n=1 Tax=Angiostrongylus cantonensis TaxID=6313 RepID=A0A0K0DIU5_ANGCA
MLGVSRFTQARDGIRSSDLRQRSKIKDAVLYAKQSKMRWAVDVMRMNDNRWTRTVGDWIPWDVKRTAGRPPARWPEFFAKSPSENVMVNESLERAEPTVLHLHATGEKWKAYWRSLESLDEKRDNR